MIYNIVSIICYVMFCYVMLCYGITYDCKVWLYLWRLWRHVRKLSHICMLLFVWQNAANCIICVALIVLCVYVCVYIYIYIHTHARTQQTCVYIYIYIYVYTHAYMMCSSSKQQYCPDPVWKPATKRSRPSQTRGYSNIIWHTILYYNIT